MGRHAAAEGASPHPLVAAALAGRPAGTGSHHRPRSAAEEGDLGWPGDEPAPGSGGLGWPDSSTDEQPEAARADATAETPRRRGWRRLFGSAPAA